MRINTNVGALRTAYQLNKADKKLSTSLSKLSSGSKLVNLSENPVGASLSVKMRTQIRNLDRASQNTADGISIIETAEGALAEIQSMVQRINELAVQGASDTYSDDDRESIMSEIDQIRQEIDRVSTDTDFNTKTLLDGNLSRRAYTNVEFADITSISDETKYGKYGVFYRDTASKASVTTADVSAADIVGMSMNLNGATAQFEQGDTLTAIYDKLKEAGEKVGITVSYTGDLASSASFTFTQNEYGSAEVVDISTSEALANALGFAEKNTVVAGTDATVTPITDGSFETELTTAATITVSGREFIVRDRYGLEMTFEVNADIPSATQPAETYIFGYVTDVGSMTIQVGANEYQELDIEIPEVSSTTLGLDDIMAYTAQGSGEAITIAQNAINRISEIRSNLGAFQNRMEHTVKTLDVTEENMTASLSRIEDVDMADEMTKYTTYNVMSQAATSMLAQANQLPDKVLQLLQ